MKYVIHSVSPTPQPFLFTFPFLTAAPMCFLGGPALIIWYVWVHGACMDHHFWHILTMWDCLAKSCDPNYPQNACKNLANARKNCQTRCIFDHVWRNMSSIALTPILFVWIYQLSSTACNQGLNRYYGLMVSLWGNHDDHNLFLHVSPKIALFSFYNFKSLRFSMKRLITLNAWNFPCNGNLRSISVGDFIDVKHV